MKLGVDYYPEHWEEARWPVDAKLMREAGIKIVRVAEFSWSRMEPREGEFEFAWLERAIGILHSEGLQVVLGTPTAAPPAWLYERYPDVYKVNENKIAKNFGTRCERCLNHPEVRRHSRIITEKMASCFSGNPAVIGWQTDNELSANNCHCENCAGRFRDWLKHKYGSLELLNATWGTVFWSHEYTAWSQVPLPWETEGGRKMHNPSLLLDYQRFQSGSAISFQQEQIDIIRLIDPNAFITHNSMGAGPWGSSLDLHVFARNLDFLSLDNYIDGWYGKYTGSALRLDETRGVKQKEFWIMEEQTGVGGGNSVNTSMTRRPLDGQIRHWIWQAIGHGAETVVLFKWRSGLVGAEQFWHGVLSHDGIPRGKYQLIKNIAKEIDTVSPELEGSFVKNEVAILNSYEQIWALQIQSQATGLEWWSQIHRYHEALTGLGVGVDIVPIYVDLSQYKMVVLPSWYILSNEDADRIAAYVKGGGRVVLSPRTGVKKADNTCHDVALPSLLREIAGLEVFDYDPLGEDESMVKLEDGQEYPVTGWADLLTLREAEAIGHYSAPVFAGEPAIARNSYGEGVCYTLGTYGGKPFYNNLFGKILDDLQADRIRELPEGVDACWRRKGDTQFLFLINLMNEAKRVKLGSRYSAVLGSSIQDGLVDLPPLEVAIYKCN